MSLECIMVVFDGLYSLELLYLANYAKTSHFQLFSMHFIQEMAQNHILLALDLFHPSEKAEIRRGTFFYHQDDILKFWHWLYFLKLNGRTKATSSRRTEHVSQTCASDRDQNVKKLANVCLEYLLGFEILFQEFNSIRKCFSNLQYHKIA